MTHEFKHIIEQAILARAKGLKSVLASVVALDGSSYRRPGVRMLIREDNTMVGAVSGGCVEKEVALQAQSVFKTGKSKMMTYDGRYRLGCEGVLYILLEEVHLQNDFEEAFFECLKLRESFKVSSKYKKEAGVFMGLGSKVVIKGDYFHLSQRDEMLNLLEFHQTMSPRFKLIIIGAEHDAVQLCQYAALTGWEVTVVAGNSEPKKIDNFKGAETLVTTTPEALDVDVIDNQTAIVLMTHNFAYDLRYLVALRHTNPNYIGLLGPSKRREDLLTQFLEYCPDISDDFLDLIHGPAGLDIGSETPQEIAISIVSEILAYTRCRSGVQLSTRVGAIHSQK